MTRFRNVSKLDRQAPMLHLNISELHESIVSSPEHEVLMVGYCDQSMSVVNNLF